MNYEFQPTCQIPIEELDEIYLKAFGFKSNGCFVEIGAHDGWHWSCTWGLAEIGWQGFYIEPVQQLFEECILTNKGRLNIDVIRCCIGEYDGVAKLGVMEYGSSLLEKNDVFEVTQLKLDTFLETRHIPIGFDLLVVDVEGAEDKVMAGFDVKKWKPKLVIIERPPVPNIFLDNDYNKVFEDWINTIYVKP